MPPWTPGTRGGEDAPAARGPRASARSGVWARRLAARGHAGVLIANVGFQEQRLCPAGAELWRREAACWAEVAALWLRWAGGCRASEAGPARLVPRGPVLRLWRLSQASVVGKRRRREVEKVRELTDLCFRQTASSPLQTGSL